MVTTSLVRDDLHLCLLECWSWTAIRGGQPPPSHRGHLASVQGLGGGGKADGGNGGGKGQGGAQGYYRKVKVSIVVVVSGMVSDHWHISPVHFRVWGVVLPQQHLGRKTKTIIVSGKNSKRILDPTSKYKSIQVFKYSSIQVLKYLSIQVFYAISMNSRSHHFQIFSWYY